MMTETAYPVEPITVEPMEKSELPTVVGLLARALRDNPSTIGMFGPDPERRIRSLRTVYAILLSDMTQAPMVARSRGHILGAIAVSPPDTCFYRGSTGRVRRIRLGGRNVSIELPSVPWRHMPGLLRLGLPALERAGSMVRAGAAHDPSQRHWHVELVGVEPEVQGRGVGRKLMEAALRQADAGGEPAHLETDTPENVAFYRHMGFHVTGQSEPLEVCTWYMERPPGASSTA